MTTRICRTCGLPFEKETVNVSTVYMCDKCLDTGIPYNPNVPQPHAAEAGNEVDHLKALLKEAVEGELPRVQEVQLVYQLKDALSKIARLEAAGDAMVNHLHFCRENAVPPHQQDIYPLDVNWQSAKQ